MISGCARSGAGHPRLRRCESKTWMRDGAEAGTVMSLAASQRALHGLDAVAFDDVADLHVLVVLKRHAAFLAGQYLARVVLEALELREPALVHHHVVADQ